MTTTETSTVPPRTTTPTIGVVVGSNRPGRICTGIAAWVLAELEGGGRSCRLVDLADVDLPFLDEPFMPALGDYRHEHTRAWSRLVGSLDGFVFVFPQYNWGYPAVLKNALDFLYREWEGKPAALVTYGTRGGEKGATQLRQVLHGLHMRPAEHNVELRITEDDVDEEWQLKDRAGLLAPYAPEVRAMGDELGALLRDGR